MNFPEKFKDFEWFSERFFSIRNRDRQIVPFKMNALQVKLHSQLAGSDDILKARKGGVSTYIMLRALHKCLTERNYRVVVLAHEHKSAIEIFEIATTAYKYLPDQLKPGLHIDNRQEIQFKGLDSRIQSHTAKNPEIGRGGTIDFLHCSEVAFWDHPETTLTSIGASLGGDPLVFRETTANGAGTWWHREWKESKAGKSGYKAHFFPWWVEPRYQQHEPELIKDPVEFDDAGRPLWKEDPNKEFEFSKRELQLDLTAPQARWRRRAVIQFKDKFEQEYAEDDITCFLTSGNMVFNSKLVRDLFEKLSEVGINPVLQRVDDLGLDVFHKFKREQWNRCQFVIGADTAEGIVNDDDPGDKGDHSSAYVVERRTGIQVASVWGDWEPYEFAHVLNEVGKRFYTADGGYPLLGVERNEYGHAVLNELKNHIHYPNLFYETTFDQAKQKAVSKVGWRTSMGTRPIMIDELVKAVNRGYLKVRDPAFLAECMTFVKNNRGRAEAQSGCHDDRVIAQAIAWQMRMANTNSVPLLGTNLTLG